MKKLNEKQTEINHQLTKLIIENKDDEETHSALISAQSAFFNYINVKEKVNLKVTPSGLP